MYLTFSYIKNYIDMDWMGRLNRPRNMIKGNKEDHIRE